MRLNFSGIEKLQKDLKKMQQAAKDLNGTHNVSFSELFTEDFMLKYTSHSDIYTLLNAGGFLVNDNDDFDSIPKDALDKHISEVTEFNTWDEMLDKAVSEYALRKLGL